jgi:hypothetical protein
VPKRNSLWILVTAGLGSNDFEGAARRVAIGAERYPCINRTVVLTTENIGELCPEVNSTYGHLLRTDVRGFGFMAWKAEVVYSVLEQSMKESGSTDVGVIWADAGCEVFYSTLAHIRLHRLMNAARNSNLAFFTLKTTEIAYSKPRLLDFLALSEAQRYSEQRQTTCFFIYGETGLRFARKWLDVTLLGQWTVDESISEPVSADFVAHRHDQSVFSSLSKSMKLGQEFQTPPTNFRNTLRGLRALTWPIWVARNRTPSSIIRIKTSRTRKKST